MTLAIAPMRAALRKAPSISAVARTLGVHRTCVDRYCVETIDPELRQLYVACVERGKRVRPNPPLPMVLRRKSA